MAARRFPNTPYGPLHLRHLLRARTEPGERVVGFAIAQLSPSPLRVVAQIILAFIPGVGHVAALAMNLLRNERRAVILTSRRLLLLKVDRSGPDPTGRGVLAELPLALLGVTCSPEPEPATPPPSRARRRRASRRRIERSELAARVAIFTLQDLGTGGRIQLVLPRITTGATARLREALVLIALNPDTDSPYNQESARRTIAPPAHPSPATHPAAVPAPTRSLAAPHLSTSHPAPVSSTTHRRDGILESDRATTRRPAHPRAGRRRIQE